MNSKETITSKVENSQWSELEELGKKNSSIKPETVVNKLLQAVGL